MVRAGGDHQDPVAQAEARLRAVLDEVNVLDADVEALSASLADFSRRYERLLAAPFADLDAAERLVRRLQALEDETVRLTARFRDGDLEPPSRQRQGRPRRRSAGLPPPVSGAPDDPAAGGEPRSETFATNDGPEPEQAATEAEDEETFLKRLHRRLARVLHPDLATNDAERARLGVLMARVNEAWAKRDRTALELMSERVGAGEPLEELSAADRIAHLEKRIATLSNIAASLRRERERMERTRTFRLREEALHREAEGHDYFQETATELAEEAEAAYADALARLDGLARRARDLARARKTAMTQIARRGPTGTRRVFDPLAESELVRRGAAHLDRQRATRPARELARALEEVATARPWEAALTLLAFFAESAGGRPPDSLGSAAGWEERWDLLRAAWPEAPDLGRMLARLPRHLEIGLRARAGEVAGGVQLADPELLAGVRIALEREAFARIAAQVLAALGPGEKCRDCSEDVIALHMLRTRGLDELNGLACPRCGGILRSYWRYGEAEGLEALAPFALQLGLVAEQPVVLAGTTLGFQMLPAEREGFTAEKLRRRFAELYLAPYEVPLDPEAVRVGTSDGVLAPNARIAELRGLAIVVDGAAGTTEAELLELLRARIERRFKP
jgi:hypothetical protein